MPYRIFLFHFSDIMSKPVVCVHPICSVGKLVDLLKVETSCGFPVVDFPDERPTLNISRKVNFIEKVNFVPFRF